MLSLIDKIINSLEKYAEQRRVEMSKTIFPTKMKVIGVSVPNERIVIKEIKSDTKTFTEREKIDLAIELVNTNIFECQHIAYEFLGKNNKIRATLTKKDIDALGKNLDNWASVDGFSIYLAGYAWREGIISTEKIKSYWESDDFWTRRIALVSTVALNLKSQGGMGDMPRTLKICEWAVDDHHDMINKALSWALRELSKRDRTPVEDFIKKYSNRLHSRIVREVKHKLEKGTKN